MTIFWGFIGLLIIPDSPANTRVIWLTPSDREIGYSRVVSVGFRPATVIKPKVLRNKIKFTVKSPFSWLFLLAYLQFAWSQRANSYFLLYLEVSALLTRGRMILVVD